VTKAAAAASTTADPISATTDFRHTRTVAAVAPVATCSGQIPSGNCGRSLDAGSLLGGGLLGPLLDTQDTRLS